MADRPIIFSAPMVRALLAGRKTQTRRILKPQPFNVDGVWWTSWRREEMRLDDIVNDRSGSMPYRIGDRLYVRENHALVPSSAYRMSEGVQQTINPTDRDLAAIYAAGWDRSKPRWRPSIHMPRWASRLTLIVTDVRVERLQDISEADARAEGASPAPGGWWSHAEGQAGTSAIASFAILWNSINGPESWQANPWVVAVGFSVHASNIDQIAPVASAPTHSPDPASGEAAV